MHKNSNRTLRRDLPAIGGCGFCEAGIATAPLICLRGGHTRAARHAGILLSAARKTTSHLQ